MWPRDSWLGSLAFWVCILTAGSFGAQAAEAPLTLEAVLAHAGRPHPDLDAAQAQLEIARAEQMLAESQDDFRLSLEAVLATGRNELTEDRFQPNHIARLSARKLLWDGGRSELFSSAAQLESAGRAEQLLSTLNQRRLALMTRFFDVLLADLQYTADTEFMAVAYVNWDNARERQQLGELSIVAVADLEARYQELRVKRNETLRRVREKRALLAAAMNRPGEMPAELADPELKGNDRVLPEMKVLLAGMLENNPRLRAQRQLLDASRQRLAAQRADHSPSLEFEAETAAYSRDSLVRDNLRAGINLVWPLYQGGRVDSRVAREQAQFQLLQSQHDRLVLDLRQVLIETREEIQHLLDYERRAAEINAQSRGWTLERAQAEYELEMKSNLGNSMADTQAAKLRKRAVEYRLALAWERLSALLGQSAEHIKITEKP